MWDWLKALYAEKARRPLKVWFDAGFRLPLAGLEERLGLDPRRAEDALQFLLHSHSVVADTLGRPSASSFADLALVHTPEYLDALEEPQAWGEILAIDISDAVIDELLRTFRLGCGATLAAARDTLREQRPNLNLLGGFHHAMPARGAGFCPLNDVVIAIRALRRDGWQGDVAIIDVDAHPPDGTAACLRDDDRAWLGSLSPVEWDAPKHVHELRVPKGCEDDGYLAVLGELLAVMPKAALTFVVAGGDVLKGDRLGALGLSLDGVRARDHAIFKALDGRPQVWLPAGGYGPQAWKVLAGTGLMLAFGPDARIPDKYDPLAQRFAYIARGLKPEELGAERMLSEADFPELYGKPAARRQRLLGFYTAQGVELGWERYGLLEIVRRLGYRDLRVELGHSGGHDQVRLLGIDTDTGKEHTLVELSLSQKVIGADTFLFVNWLSLRHPRAKFSAQRPQLPGQDVPGLGLAREASQLTALVAKRLGLAGVAFCPSWYHMAYAARHTSRFIDAKRQGRFEALVRDTAGRPLLEVTQAVAAGRVQLNAVDYKWEPDEMVFWLDANKAASDGAEVEAERERCRFTIRLE